MPTTLKYIELEDFKSYRGQHRIGPLRRFTAVIGPNGSDERKFSRSVHGSSSEYKIDGETVTSAAYMRELEALGINVKAKNFLVFQGAVESIAMKNPKERTQLFEEMSGSGLLKDEYDRLKAEVSRAETETQLMFQRKKGFQQEKKEALHEKDEAEKFQRLSNELEEKRVQHELFILFHNEEAITQLERDLEKKQRELNKGERKKSDVEEKVKEKRKEHGKKTKELASVEQDIREAESEVSKKRPQYIKSKERVAHDQKKLDSSKKSLTQATTAHEALMADIADLERQLQEVEAAHAEFRAEFERQSQDQGRDPQQAQAEIMKQSTTDSITAKVRLYHQLKEQADKESARYMQELDSINREQKNDQDQLDNETRRKADSDNKFRNKTHELEEAEKRVRKLEEHIVTYQENLEEQNRMRSELQAEVGTSRGRVDELQAKLEDVSKRLGDARVDKREEERRKKKEEVVVNLRRLYPGVYDRVVHLCSTNHSRYNIAVTKVFARNMDAIVVDTQQTAKQCVQYLKEQSLDVETFLPLDFILVEPLKERLRSRAVALDGTFYQRSGIISGGAADLAKKAKRWDDKELENLKREKDRLFEEVKQAQKKSRKESELNLLESQIKGLEQRMKISRQERETTNQQIKKLKKELTDLENSMKTFVPRIQEIESRMEQRGVQIQQKKIDMNQVEDRVFQEFCVQVGVSDIREYEDRELRSQEERLKRDNDYENQKNRLQNQLEYEKSRNLSGEVSIRRCNKVVSILVLGFWFHRFDSGTADNVSRWERAVQDAEDELERAKQAEAKQMAEIDKEMRRLDKLKNEKNAKKAEFDAIEEELNKLRKEQNSAVKECQVAAKHVGQIEAKVEAKKQERQSQLRSCKVRCGIGVIMSDIKIPLLEGTLDDIEGPDSSQSQSSQRESQTPNIVVDYSLLPEDLKDDLDDDRLGKAEEKLRKEIRDLENILQKIQAPNRMAISKLADAKHKLQSTNEELETRIRRTKQIKADFERVKRERCNKFNDCFDHVSNEIDTRLARNDAAQAFLGPENPEEPYLDGINYNCVAPGKRFQPMSNLSGGEKTVAALALLFSIHSHKPAPFFVLDEIDAALDNTNIGKVASYIRSKMDELQCIVISLKEEFYTHSDSLIGICPDVGDCTISRVLTKSLEDYEDVLPQVQQNLEDMAA
ncbi:unnamed protein product [Cyprideis torosa]|uniref:Structural maintenance of chromosomes protein n=1 Tax=Cyprideis torosa TaxID=163714 RepID=A0A7R8ZNR6_9CRUS|nr:unnamed protein product [Cyprideis torosa]CAG0888326.1 unnamed protein product [Cyprideis torosa]